MSELLLISVPGVGLTGRPVVRVLVVPRLEAAESVAATAIAEWPRVLAGARCDITIERHAAPVTQPRQPPPHGFEGPPSFETSVIEAVPAATHGDLDAWQSFLSNVPVEDGRSSAAAGPSPVVTPTTDHVAKVEKTYRAAAAAEIDVQAGEHAALENAVRLGLETHWSTEDRPTERAAAPATPAPVDAEFHRIVSMLAEHPAVLRTLGLIFDLPIPDPDEIGQVGRVRVSWHEPAPGLPAVVSPWTAYEVHADRGFMPASTDIVKAGVLDLGDESRWGMTTLDIDGAAARLRDAARTVASSAAPPRLPALRSAGIALLHRGRDAHFADRRAAAQANAARGAADAAATLTADDLMLGLRIDVRTENTNTWWSLCRRRATYTIDQRELRTPEEEEGHVKATAAVRVEGDVLRADEIVTRWNGWSLAVPRQRPGTERTAVRRPDLPFRFEWDFTVPDGSLPQLRFGRNYHLRARVADRAGGGVGPDDPDLTVATSAISYARHEPVGSPQLRVPEELDDTSLGPGGAIDQLVIRTAAPDYPRNDERLLAPPTTTLDIAEQHAVLDDAQPATFELVKRALAAGLRDPMATGVTIFTRPEPGGLRQPDSESLHTSAWAPWPEATIKQLVLKPRDPAENRPAVRSFPDRIEVHLLPAEQATLELSSLLRNDWIHHLALRHWRANDVPTSDVTSGRHPMVTPPCTVTLVHAVRRPLKTPRGPLTPSPDRLEGRTSARLVPSTALLNVDPASTQQLQIVGSWTEVNDDARREVVDAPVCSDNVDRGDDTLGTPLIHEFSDTRHRTIAYSLIAVSRFRHLFNPDEPDERFQVRTNLESVSVKSTRRPPLPAVRAVVPAIRWEDSSSGSTIRSRRVGGLLRVELLRPWHMSGDNERLAVVVEHTEAGRDPIWDTPGVDRKLPAAAFMASDIASATLPDGRPVTIALYPTLFTGDHWVADIELPSVAAASYRPFVRLTVARYQRESLAGLELSEAVKTDFVQLLPDRVLTVEASDSDGRYVVTLEGAGPAGPNRNRVDVVVERCAPRTELDVTALAPPDGLSAWTAVAQFSGSLGEPITFQRPTGPLTELRLRVREVELLAPPGAPPPSRAGTAAELSERVVCADIVALPDPPVSPATEE